MGVPLINVLYQKGDPGTIGVLSTPLLLYHVEQLILGNIEVEILKKWVARGKKREAEKQKTEEMLDDDSSDQHPTLASTHINRDEENVYGNGVTQIEEAHYNSHKGQ